MIYHWIFLVIFLELGHNAAYANSSLLEDWRMIHSSHASYGSVASRICGFQQVLPISRPVISLQRNMKVLELVPKSP